jgi:hypothetical protein
MNESPTEKQKPQFEFITWADTTSSNALEVEALSYDTSVVKSPIASGDFVIVEDLIQNRQWFGQVIQPQLDLPRGLSRDNPNSISALERVLTTGAKDNVFLDQVFYYRIQLLGEVTNGSLESVRVRPRYGARGRRASILEVTKYIRLPEKQGKGVLNNVLGRIHSSTIPVCIDKKRIYYHNLVAGATGQGKSNTIANIIKSAQALGMACIVFDHKPDYQDMHKPNSSEKSLFERFAGMSLEPFGLKNVNYFCLFKVDDDRKREDEKPISIPASVASHGMLATALFYRQGEELQREAFFSMLPHFAESRKGKGAWTLKEFLAWVNTHKTIEPPSKKGGKDQISWARLSEYFGGSEPNEKVIGAMLNRISTRKPEWMDIYGSRNVNSNGAVSGLFDEEEFNTAGEVDGEDSYTPTAADIPQGYFDPKPHLKAGSVMVIRIPDSSDGREYGLFLSYLLRRVYNLRRLKKIDCPVLCVIDEAQDIFNGASTLRDTAESTINEVLRKGRSKHLGFVISVQSSSQLPTSIINNLNSRIIHRQNTTDELRYAMPDAPKDLLNSVLSFGAGEALVKMFGATAPVRTQMAPSPFELTKETEE